MKISIQDHTEPGTVVLDASFIDQLTRGKIIDAPVTLLREDPPVWILPTAMQQNGKIFLSHTFLKGYLGDLSDAQYRVINEHELFSVPEHLKGQNNGRHWITNLLHTEDGVLAFLHSEYAGENDFFGMPAIKLDGAEIKAPGRSAIGLAWLPKDRFDAEHYRFDYLGHIATYGADIPHFNVSGTPVYVTRHDGVEYVNILFSDIMAEEGPEGWTTVQKFVSQARAPLAEVVARAQKGECAGWLKRDGDDWRDAMGKSATGILPRVKGHPDRRIAVGDVIVHSDIAQLGPNGPYILVGYVLVQKNRNPSCLVVYSSEDGSNWKFETTSNERFDCIQGWSYVKLLDKGRRNGDRHPYALIGWEYGKGKDARAVYRLALQISDT